MAPARQVMPLPRQAKADQVESWRYNPALVDELNQMPQSSRTMRLLRILLASVVCACTTALAQTNNLENRSMSLADCIAIALEHNLDVKIRRLNPEINRLTLNSAYGAYDPSFSASGEHDYSRSPGGVDPQGRAYGGTASESD